MAVATVLLLDRSGGCGTWPIKGPSCYRASGAHGDETDWIDPSFD
jgi:hypothetical protein